MIPLKAIIKNTIVFLLLCLVHQTGEAQYSISGPSSTDVGDTETFTVSNGGSLLGRNWSATGSGNTVVSGQGTISAGIRFNTIGNSIVNFSAVTPGTFNSVYLTKNVTVSGTVVGPVTITSGPTSRCQGGGTSDYNASASNATSYSWSLSNAGSSTINSLTGVVTWSSSFSGTARVNVTANGPNNSSSSAFRNVTVTAAASLPPMTTTDTDLCSGSSATLTIPFGASGTTYELLRNNVSIQTVAGDNTAINWPVSTAGTYRARATKGGCPPVLGNTITINVSQDLGSPQITGTNELCQGTATTDYNITGGTSQNTYVWSVSGNGNTINSSGLVSWGASFQGSASVSVQATSACGTTTTVSYPVQVIGPPSLPPLDPSDTDLCSGESATLSLPFAESGTTYELLRNNVSIETATGANTRIDWTVSTAGTYRARATKPGCSSVLGNTIVVSVSEDLGSPQITGTDELCQGTATTDYNITGGTSQNTYVWSVSGNGNTINSSGLVSWGASFQGSASVSIQATSACGTTTTVSYPVQVIGPPAFSPLVPDDSTLCSGQQTTLRAGFGASGVVYELYRNNIGTGQTVTGSNTEMTWTISSTGDYKLVASNPANNCGTFEGATVNVSTEPPIGTVSAISGPDNLCQGDLSTSDYSGSAANAESYNWQLSPTGAGTINASGQVTWNTSFAGTATITLTAFDVCGDSRTRNLTVTIVDELVFFEDKDKDGYYIATIVSCANPDPNVYVLEEATIAAGDCDDNDDTVLRPENWFVDADEDGYPAADSFVISCENPGIVSGNPENYSYGPYPGIDCDDTDGTIKATKWFIDEDNDGLGTPSSTSLSQCEQPTQGGPWVSNNDDYCPNNPENDCGNGPPNTNFGANYVYKRTFQKSATDVLNDDGVDQNNLAFFTPTESLIQQISYFDDLGRPVQEIALEQSPKISGVKKDLVVQMEYDGYGRTVKEWLPYAADTGDFGSVKTDAEQQTLNQYDNAKYENTANPYSEKAFDNSPLQRIEKQAAPGSAWAMGSGHEVEFGYRTNVVADNVRHFEATVTVTIADGIKVFTPSLANLGNYSAGELFRTITYDENHTSGKNHSMEEFTDKQGRVVLKRTYSDMDVNLDGDTDDSGESEVAHDTYYVYDDFGNLSYVLPPKVTVNNGVNNTELVQLCYQYKYDYRNRLVEKRLPGKNWEYIVYDKLDRPILTQQYRYRNSRNWLFTKYDAFGRVAYTGIYKHGTKLTGTEMQALVNTTNTGDQFERKLAVVSGNGYYSKDHFPNGNTTTFPGSQLTPLMYNYYDDYVFDKNGLVIPNTIYGVSPDNRTKGLLTGTRVRMIHTNKWIVTMNGFDAKGRIIWTGTKNLFLGITDRVLIDLDFLGRTVRQRTLHKKNGKPQIVINETFMYDHTGRLSQHRHKIGSGVNTRIAYNTYDDLARLTHKKVGGAVNASELQKVDYEYNIRGWLTDINTVENLQDDLFSMRIHYENGSTSTDLYNGNISKIATRTANLDNAIKEYNYNYDALNRLTSATHNTGNYNLGNVAYDKNGNILRLQRLGLLSDTGSTYGVIDDLSYTYLNNGQSNRLSKVADGSANSMGFADGTNTNDDYTYDADGNMKRDRNKDITQNIGYNHLNLPTVVKFGSGSTNRINYYYDALGTKHRKQVREGNTVTGTTNYAGLAVYQGNTLEFLSHPEGYTMPSDASDYAQGFAYVYNHLDHLGNVRLSYTDVDGSGDIDPSTEIIEENNYYPLGLKIKGLNNTISSLGNSSAKKYKYNNKELQDELGLDWYDLGSRNYDASLGRFFNMDPLAENYSFQSVYAFASNNPISFVDINGEGVLDDFHIYGDGSILRVKTDDTTDTFYVHDSNGNKNNIGTFDKNENGLINSPNIDYDNGNGTSVKVSSKPGNESEINISGTALASVIGASADSGESVLITRASNADGSSPGDSKTHKNGKNIDIRFAGKNGSRSPLNFATKPDDFNKIDLNASSSLNASLKKFGYKDIRASMKITTHKTETTGVRSVRSQSSQSIPGTRHLSRHSDHQHLQGYRPNVTVRNKAVPIPTLTRGVKLN